METIFIFLQNLCFVSKSRKQVWNRIELNEFQILAFLPTNLLMNITCTPRFKTRIQIPENQDRMSFWLRKFVITSDYFLTSKKIGWVRKPLTEFKN